MRKQRARSCKRLGRYLLPVKGNQKAPRQRAAECLPPPPHRRLPPRHHPLQSVSQTLRQPERLPPRLCPRLRALPPPRPDPIAGVRKSAGPVSSRPKRRPCAFPSSPVWLKSRAKSATRKFGAPWKLLLYLSSRPPKTPPQEFITLTRDYWTIEEVCRTSRCQRTRRSRSHAQSEQHPRAGHREAERHGLPTITGAESKSAPAIQPSPTWPIRCGTTTNQSGTPLPLPTPLSQLQKSAIVAGPVDSKSDAFGGGEMGG